MQTKKLIVFLIALIFSISTVYAFAFDVDAKPVNDHIPIEGKAVFDITVKNFLNSTEEFKIRNFDYPIWDINSEPISNPITISAAPNSESTIRIYVNSLQPVKTPVGTYSVNARVDLDSLKLSQDLPLTVAITSADTIGGYIPNVKIALLVPKKAEQDKPFTIKILLNNLNPIDYRDLKVKVSSNFINEEIKTNLSPPGAGSIQNPDSEKTLEITKLFDKDTTPQKDRIYVDVLFGARKIASQTAEYEIMEYIEQGQPVEQKQFLRSTITIRAKSNNPSYKGTIRKETTIFKNLFASANPQAEFIKEGEKYYYVWNVDFNGRESIEVSVTENYRPLFVLAGFIIALVILYFVFRSPLVAKKEVANIKMSEGGVSDLKVIIKVRNRSSNPLSNIEVTDTIPSIAEVEKEISIGSMQPAKLLRHAHKGVLIKWDIESLEAGDERVLSYKFKSRLAILGEFHLPSASARCIYGKRHVISNSNRAIVSSHH